MNSFIKFLEYQKAAAGGAFGKSTSAYDFSNDKQGSGLEHKFQSYQIRVQQGKRNESVIMEALKQWYNVRPASESDDKFKHIDCYIREKTGGQETPVQIKYRTDGETLVMEVVKFWTPAMFQRKLEANDFNGRDMDGTAVLYIGLNSAKDTIRIRKISEAREISRKLADMLVHNYQLLGKRSLFMPEGNVRITFDPANGRQKVMAFLNPEAFSFKKDLKPAKPLTLS